MALRRTGAAILMVLYLAVFFGLTLGGLYQANPRPNFEPFRTIRQDLELGGSEFVINVLGNLAAGLPMGLLLPSLLGRRCSWAKVAGLALAVSLLIESLQGISGRRVADVDDLILNTSGALLGYGFLLAAGRAWAWGSRGRPDNQRKKRVVADWPPVSKNG
jgi:glycopeptide antibiotics resistance protein